MIKAESIKDKRPLSDGFRIKCKVSIGMPDNLISVSEEVFIAELVAIFKQLYKVNPQIILDALESYREVLKDD